MEQRALEIRNKIGNLRDEISALEHDAQVYEKMFLTYQPKKENTSDHSNEASSAIAVDSSRLDR